MTVTIIMDEEKNSEIMEENKVLKNKIHELELMLKMNRETFEKITDLVDLEITKDEYRKYYDAGLGYKKIVDKIGLDNSHKIIKDMRILSYEGSRQIVDYENGTLTFSFQRT